MRWLVHGAVVLLGVLSFLHTDVYSSSVFYNAVLPLFAFLALMYVVVLIAGKLPASGWSESRSRGNGVGRSGGFGDFGDGGGGGGGDGGGGC